MSDSPQVQMERILSEAQMSEAQECGGRFAANKLDRVEIANAMAQSMGTNPTYEQWEEFRKWFVDGFVTANPKATGNAADAAWAEFAQLLKAMFCLEKPKAQTKAATKKAEERATKKAALMEKYEKDSPEAVQQELAAAYESLATDPTNKVQQKTVKELSTVLKAKTAEERAEIAARVAELKRTIRARLTNCDDPEILGQIVDLLGDFA